MFGGSRQLDFEHIAQYAAFLKDLHEVGYKVQASTDPDQYQQVSDYLVKQMEVVDGEELLRSQSLYEMIKHTREKIDRVNQSHANTRQQVREWKQLQEKVHKERALRDSIAQHARTAPRNV